MKIITKITRDGGANLLVTRSRLDQCEVAWGCTVEACQQEDALGKQWWRLACNIPNLGLAKGQQQTSELCCRTTRQIRNQVLDVNEALTFTVDSSSNTKAFPAQ